MHAGGRYLDPEMAASAMMAGGVAADRAGADALALAASGASVSEIATSLHLSEGTVRNYLSNAIAKLGAVNRIGAIRTAQDMGWI